MRSMKNNNDKKMIRKNKKVKEILWITKGQQKMNVMVLCNKCWNIRWKVVKILDLFSKEWCSNRDRKIGISKRYQKITNLNRNSLVLNNNSNKIRRKLLM